MSKVCAIVVTFNRKELLKKCINALLNQTHKIDNIIVVNNASTDGTEKEIEGLKKETGNTIIDLHLEKNIGGAGGFYEGIKFAYNNGYDYFWIMDDDTIAEATALEELIHGFNKIDKKIGFLSSNVMHTDGTACKMNVPEIANVWNSLATEGYIELKSTSFVSVLIKRDVIGEVGLPIKEFFIWGDDAEYTTRITKLYPSYLYTKSVVCHEMKENKDVNIALEGKERIGRYFYEYRNKYYIYKIAGNKSGYYKYLIKTILSILKNAEDSKKERLKVVLKGYREGKKFNPKVENFK